MPLLILSGVGISFGLFIVMMLKGFGLLFGTARLVPDQILGIIILSTGLPLIIFFGVFLYVSATNDSSATDYINELKKQNTGNDADE